jgi:hypothetical protein
MTWIATQPKLAHLLGKALFFVGGLLIICGLIGRAGMIAINHTRNLGKLPALSGLSSAYPMYTLWWVPETFLGYAVAAVIAAAGLYLALTAKRLLKAMNPRGQRRRRN